MIPTREEANQLLLWAGEQNPGVWTNHCKVVARAAEAIAVKCGLDTHRAYVSGLLHDIGRYAGVRGLYHSYAGYELLKKKGYNEIADVCISHSFSTKNINEFFGENDCTPEEIEIIRQYLTESTYTDYDKLIQLCDVMCVAEGVTLIEVRIMDVIRRYGLANVSLNRIEAFFERKKYFDNLCGMNIYDLFYDEIRDVSFR
ncbi:MAG: HD domain-containing protein [Oscillospiraceae bacterium]|nr:HD domain-containing protein [Oscillospiraceae bacterium]